MTGWRRGGAKREHLAVGLVACCFATQVAVPPSDIAGPPRESPRSLLYVWAADKGLPVTSPVGARNELNVPVRGDFLAVVDADPASSTYGKVLLTRSVPTLPVGNEAHHVSPFIPSGCSTLLANGLVSDSWTTFDVSDPLDPSVLNTVTGLQTVGTVPGHAFVLPNCQSLGAETGGAAAGPHGTVIRLDSSGADVLEERSADRIGTDTICESQWRPLLEPDKPGGPFTRKTARSECLPSNPLGISARPDLDTLITSDYADPLRLVLPAPTSDITKFTVRHYPLNPACTGSTTPVSGTRCIGEPRVVVLPDGPRAETNERDEENIAVEGLAVTNPAGSLNPTGGTPPAYLASKGAFAATTCGGALYYTADVRSQRPAWRQVFDFSAAATIAAGERVPAACVGGGGLAVTPDNRFVVATIIGREPGQTSTPMGPTTDLRPFPAMVVLLDVSALIRAGATPSCTIDDAEEIWRGGAEADCPSIASIHSENDRTSGGPHDLAVDYPNGGHRIAYFNYFVSHTGIGGDLRVCMLMVNNGQLLLDPRFPAAVDGQEAGTGCISFDRPDWPADRGHGAGPAKPHHGLFRNTLPRERTATATVG